MTDKPSHGTDRYRRGCLAEAQAHLATCARLNAELARLPWWRWYARRWNREKRASYALEVDRLLWLAGS